MAAGVFADRLKDIGEFTISSAGLHAVVGEPAVFEAQEAMQQIGIDISMHRAQQLTVDMVSAADLILVMERWHKKEVEKLMPESRGKVYLLGNWSDFEVPDPYSESAQVFEQCLQLIERSWGDWKFRLRMVR